MPTLPHHVIEGAYFMAWRGTQRVGQPELDLEQKPDLDMSDDDLRARTERLLTSAELIAEQLQAQTKRLEIAIEQFDRDIIAPLRRGLTDE
jgi:hypothetical protein